MSRTVIGLRFEVTWLRAQALAQSSVMTRSSNCASSDLNMGCQRASVLGAGLTSVAHCSKSCHGVVQPAGAGTRAALPPRRVLIRPSTSDSQAVNAALASAGVAVLGAENFAS